MQMSQLYCVPKTERLTLLAEGAITSPALSTKTERLTLLAEGAITSPALSISRVGVGG